MGEGWNLLGDVAMVEDIAQGRRFREVRGSPNIQPRKSKMRFNATLGVQPFVKFSKKVGPAVFTSSEHCSLALKKALQVSL